MKAEDLINSNSLINIEVIDGQTVVFTEIAMTTVNMVRLEAKQSPWISVEERLPEEGQKVFVLVMCYGTPCIREEKFCRNSNLDKKGMWIHGNSIVLAWFPTPSFDEILEANKDVLERIKEKGDRIQTCSPMK